MSDDFEENAVMLYTTEIVSAYFSHNAVAPQDIPLVIETVHSSLRVLASGGQEALDRPKPAVAINKSITPDFLICLEDGKQLKMLKRHLKTAYDMTPEQYRERWDLPHDYPMTAPNYAKKRSKLAKDIGLGTKS